MKRRFLPLILPMWMILLGVGVLILITRITQPTVGAMMNQEQCCVRLNDSPMGLRLTSGNSENMKTVLPYKNTNPTALIAMQNGSSTWGGIVLTTSAETAVAVRAGDLDDDGDLDILAAAWEDDTITWYENNGAAFPTFVAHSITTSASGTRDIYVADIDGDDDGDILSAHPDDDKVIWHKNNGGQPPTFTSYTITTSADHVRSVYAADINNDGHTDVLYAARNDDTVTWNTAGQKLLHVTAESGERSASSEFIITINVPPAQLAFEGSELGSVNTVHNFTVTISPLTTTLPITYTWEATGKSPLIQPARHSFTATTAFTWTTTGPKQVRVTANNSAGATSTAHDILIASSVENVHINGPTSGAINTSYTFTATLNQETVLLPVTYIWTPKPDAGQGSPVVTYTWATGGQHLLQVTATNALGAAWGYHDITLAVPPDTVTIEGVKRGDIRTMYPFTASVAPPSATLFMTYTWIPEPVQGQGSSFATYVWDTAGDKRISVTAANPSGSAIGYHTLTIRTSVYLPIILRSWPQPPHRPTLNPIVDIENGTYTVSWTELPSRIADRYIVQEARNTTFTSSVVTPCITTQQSCSITFRSQGTYYYRVRGQNAFGYSEWSNVQAATVPRYPILCSVEITTTDKAPFGNHSIANAAFIADYFGQSLLDVDGSTSVPPTTTATIPVRSDFYRLDNAKLNYHYTIQAKPDRTLNYNLGIIVYDKEETAIYTDTDTSDNSASATFQALNTGPYYIAVFQISAQCSGSTYQLLYNAPVAPTPIPAALPVSDSVRFLGFEKGMRFEGVVTASESHNKLYDEEGHALYPYGVFVVAVIDITNYGLESDTIERLDSFRVQDEVGRKFDIADPEVLEAAEHTFGLPSVPIRIQPGFTVPMVFVFDVLPRSQTLHLVAVNPW